MEFRPIGTRYEYLESYNVTKHKPYNYKRYGLLNKLFPKVIYETKNKSTKTVLDFLEQMTIFLLKYVDILKYFKNPCFKRF